VHKKFAQQLIRSVDVKSIQHWTCEVPIKEESYPNKGLVVHQVMHVVQCLHVVHCHDPVHIWLVFIAIGQRPQNNAIDSRVP
jgi:hypothetical protein